MKNFTGSKSRMNKICMKKLKNDSFCEYTQSTRNSMNRKSGKYENEWQRRVEKMSSARPPRVVGRGGAAERAARVTQESCHHWRSGTTLKRQNENRCRLLYFALVWPPVGGSQRGGLGEDPAAENGGKTPQPSTQTKVRGKFPHCWKAPKRREETKKKMSWPRFMVFFNDELKKEELFNCNKQIMASNRPLTSIPEFQSINSSNAEHIEALLMRGY